MLVFVLVVGLLCQQIVDGYDLLIMTLARVMRYEMKKRGVKKLKVVFSDEQPVQNTALRTAQGKPVPGSTAFVPSAAGLVIASEVIKDLVK